METLPHPRIDQILAEANFAHLAVISDGDPYVGPLSFVVFEDALYFRTLPGERVEALRAHPHAAASIVEFDENTGAWESVLVRGRVNFVESDRAEDVVVLLFLDKYREYTSELGSGPRLEAQDAEPGWIGTPEVASEDAIIFGLSIREVTGRTSGRWMTPGTRPGRL